MGNLRRQRRKERHRVRREAETAWDKAAHADLAAAERILRNALKSRPEDGLLWCDLGLILWRQERLREAEKALRRALLMRPEYEDAKMNLAALLAARGFYRQALALEEELASRGSHRDFHRQKVEEYRRKAEAR